MGFKILFVSVHSTELEEGEWRQSYTLLLDIFLTPDQVYVFIHVMQHDLSWPQ